MRPSPGRRPDDVFAPELDRAALSRDAPLVFPTRSPVMTPFRPARPRRNTTAPRQPLRPALELLEDRTVPSLVAALDFGEASGTAVLDSSGTGNNGTITGATRTALGKYGGALSFNGTGDLVTVADSASLHLTNGMTLEAWVKPTAASGGWATALLKERGTAGLAYALYAADGAG